MANAESSSILTKGVKFSIVTVIIGACLIALLRITYPETPVKEYLTIVVIASIILAAVFLGLWYSWKKKRRSGEQKKLILSFIWFLIPVMAVPLLISCAGMQVGERRLFHLWDQLVKEGTEKSGYGMYTYVLFGRRIDYQTSVDSETLNRYQSLLEAIIQSTPTELEAKVDKAESNIFYIPVIKSHTGTDFPLKNYNSSLAFKYITRLAKMIKNDYQLVERFTMRPGPFLISTLNPLGKTTRGEFKLLYTDLSDSNPAAMKDTISAYKKRISKQGVSGVEKFEPFRLSLLNWILNINDNLKIVKAEASAWKEK